MEKLRRWKESLELKQEPEEAKKRVKKAMDETAAEMRYDTGFLLRSAYAEYLKNTPLDKKVILYEAFAGRGMICNPFALFQFLLKEKKYEQYQHIWVIDDFEDNQDVIEKYDQYPNVKFVKYQSADYCKYLATAGYLINNVSFPGYFTKRPGQIYLNTWHGVPMKTMGFDIPGGNVSSGNSAKNLLSADFLLSAGSYMTQKAYQESYKLQGLYEGIILEEGFPRNDGFFHGNAQQTIQNLQKHGVKIDPGKKIILYAPTWKGDTYSNPDVGVDSYLDFIHCLEERIDTSQYQVLVKPHQIVYYHMKEKHQVTGQFIPATMDTNEILALVDILVSDYSSIYFDFLVSGKPILFYLPDKNDFDNYRGLYFDTDKLPGPIASTGEELADFIINLNQIKETFAQKYQEQRQWANPWDDGEVCSRVVKRVFEKKKGSREVICKDNMRKKLLFYGSDFSAGHITFSFLALLDKLDYSKYDVTVLASAGTNQEAQRRINNLPQEVRVLYWKPFYDGTIEEIARHTLISKGAGEKVVLPRAYYRRELVRAVGGSKFDYVIALSNENPIFAAMFHGVKKTKFVEWKGDMIDLPRISMELARENVITIGSEKQYITREVDRKTSVVKLETIPLPKKDHENFVSMGSLRNGKNMEALIKEFGLLYQKRSDTHLYLIGNGPEKNRFVAFAKEKGLIEGITFLGDLKYPLGFMKQCSCFVLDTGLEGLSLSALEARTLGLPVVYGKRGMEDFCDGKITAEEFYPEEYNQEVYQKFENLLKG